MNMDRSSLSRYALHVRESLFWNSESGKVLLLEYGILGFGIRNRAQGIWNPTHDWNLESNFH